jgi:hypothetical protein
MWLSLSRTDSRISWRAASTVGALALSLTILCAAGSKASGLGEAGPVLDAYFVALKTGDVAALGELLGGDLLASRRALLTNPLYPDQLIKDFGDAEFEVIDWSRHRTEAISVDVVVVLDANETVKWRLTMQPDLTAQSGWLIVDLTL